MDGCITLSTLKSNSLEINKKTFLTFNHLPRALRKSNMLGDKHITGIIASTGYRSQIFIAGKRKLSIKNLNL